MNERPAEKWYAVWRWQKNSIERKSIEAVGGIQGASAYTLTAAQ